MSIPRRETSSFFKDLTSLLGGYLVLPEDAGYDQARQHWNGRIDKHPAAIVYCANVQDVIHTVQEVRSHGFPLSVRAGGYDFAGRALCEGGVVIDCSQMRAVTIDSEACTARVQGGATVSDLIVASQEYGLATTSGTMSSIGLAGLTLGGGYGPVMGKYGLVADNLLSAQVVTADGQLLTADATDNASLLWGLRGGGGNFGVVVSLEYRLHPITKVFAGSLLYSLDQAREVLSSYGEFIKTAPDELTINAGFTHTPDGTPALYLSPVYCGPPEEGERMIKPLRSFGKPLADQFQLVSYDTLINATNVLAPRGRHYFIQTQSLDSLSTRTIDVLVEYAQQFPSPFSLLAILHFHGAASRVGATETAFALRQDHLLIEFIASWEPLSLKEDQRHVQWAQEGSCALAPYALKEGYISALDEGEQERVRLAFGLNYERLLGLKRMYDPDDVFHSTIGHIKPIVS